MKTPLLPDEVALLEGTHGGVSVVTGAVAVEAAIFDDVFLLKSKTVDCPAISLGLKYVRIFDQTEINGCNL
jgi:hypothetical protein